MKFKGILPLIGTMAILSSCNGSSISGNYGFQMGKDAGTHFMVDLQLTDEAFEVPDTTDSYKKFVLSVDFKNGTGELDNEGLDEIMSFFKDESGTAKLPGYYRLTDEVNKAGENRLVFGLDVDYVKTKAVEIAKHFLEDDSFNLDGFDFSGINESKLLQSLLYATYKDNYVNLYLPVSYEDAYYQLYWYGVDLKFSLTGGEEEVPFTFSVDYLENAHEYGTVPTEADVEEINKTFAQEHEGNVITTYRAFHQVKVGLGKK